MPELPEVETVRRQLEPHLSGRAVVSCELHDPGARWVPPMSFVVRQVEAVSAVDRVGRYLVLRFRNPPHLALHLGMTGRLRVGVAEEFPIRHDRFSLGLSDGSRLFYNDPRGFGGGREIEADSVLGVGLDPLDPSLTWQRLRDLYRCRDRAIKVMLMDNAVVCGIGNIYASEILFKARLHPEKPASGLSDARYKKLFSCIVETLLEAISAGGSTIKNFAHLDGSSGSASNLHRVYGRGGLACPTCQTVIRMLRQSGRSTFFCPKCQKF